MKLFITGCRGFVAGSFGRYAANEGHEVFGVARSSQPDVDWPGRYAQADVAHSDLSEMIRDFAPDVVFHGAGTASVGASMATPLDDLRAALLTWANTLDSVRRSGLHPLVIFPSSAAVYGNPVSLPVREDAAIAPVSPYGFHKAACELIAREYAECFDLPMLVCRLFSVFGPAQRRLLVWELYSQIVGPDPVVWLQGLGTETRDYLAMEDVAAAVIGLAMSLLHRGGHGHCDFVNVASGGEVKVLDLAQILLGAMRVNKEIRCRGNKRPSDPSRWCADTKRLRNILPEWTPQRAKERLAECLHDWGQLSAFKRDRQGIQ